MKPLRRRMVCRLFVVGALLGGMVGNGAAAQPISSAERAAEAERSLSAAKSEIAKMQNDLRNAQAIVTYFDIVIKNFSEYKDTYKIYEKNCSASKRELEEMLKEKNPFAHRLQPAVLRFQTNRAGFDETIRKFFLVAERIEKDVILIKKEVERIKNSSDRPMTEQKTFQLERNLEKDLRDLSEQTSEYKRPGF